MCRVCMGRVCYVPSLLWAEFVMCRVDPTPVSTIASRIWTLRFTSNSISRSGSGLGPTPTIHITCLFSYTVEIVIISQSVI